MTELQERLIRRISTTQDEDVLREIEMMLNIEDSDVPYVLNESQISAIVQAQAQIPRGEFLTNDEAYQQAKSWLKNQ